MGVIKTIIAFAFLQWVISECQDIPEWAELISYAIVMCGFIAHRED